MEEPNWLKRELEGIQAIPKIAQELAKLSHHKKLGFDKLCVIVEAALSMDISPQRALQGGFYSLRDGKIEIGYRLLSEIILKRGHQIRVLQDTPDICELEGTRVDPKHPLRILDDTTGGTITQKASFSIADAKRAGLLRPGPWTQYPQDMLYARALSRLARRLFADVITCNTYVEGEIEQKPETPTVEALGELAQG